MNACRWVCLDYRKHDRVISKDLLASRDFTGGNKMTGERYKSHQRLKNESLHCLITELKE